MTCYSPLVAYQHPTGGKPYFGQRQNPSDREIQLPCGQCMGCRLRKSRDWAIRCVHEAKQYENNIFITLTYNEDNYPQYGSLQKTHFQKFMRRLRKYVSRETKNKTKIRFFMCGEYGEKLSRPHYHAIIFNYDFADKVLYSQRQGINLYYSPALERIWGKGFTTIGDVTFESAAYVARYVTKKIKVSEKSDDKIKWHYTSTDPTTGEIYQIEPEYTNMSRKPGIGSKFYDRYKRDIYPSDEITHQGRVLRVPAYYDKLHTMHDEQAIKSIKKDRLKRAQAKRFDTTPERLKVREKVQKLKLKSLNRSYENEN